MLSTWSRIRSTGRSAWPTAKAVTAPSSATRPMPLISASSIDRVSAAAPVRVDTATSTV